MEWFLLTGQPQTGKTTVINKTIENINEEFKDNNKHTALEIRGIYLPPHMYFIYICHQLLYICTSFLYNYIYMIYNLWPSYKTCI